MDVEVRASRVQGVGIFATRDFRAGDVILRRDEAREVTADLPLRADLGEERRHCDDLANGRVVVLGYPERHLNHSCESNVYIRFIEGAGHIAARRDIAAGEELTNDYCINCFEEGAWSCACGSIRCRKHIRNNFFEEPLDVQRAYLPLLADWFIAKHPQEVQRLRHLLAR